MAANEVIVRGNFRSTAATIGLQGCHGSGLAKTPSAHQDVASVWNVTDDRFVCLRMLTISLQSS